jgi:hypothetical protein
MTNDRITSGHHIPFWQTPNQLIDDGHVERMGASGFAIYMILFRHSNAAHQCFPSYSLLQKRTGFSRTTIAKAIAELVEKGYIRKLNIGNAVHSSTLYQLLDLSLVPHPNPTSPENGLVQKVNQSRKWTSSENGLVTSPENEPQLVQKMDSKNTNREILISKNTNSLDAAEISDPMGDRFRGKTTDYMKLALEPGFAEYIRTTKLSRIDYYKGAATIGDAKDYIRKGEYDPVKFAAKIDDYYQDFLESQERDQQRLKHVAATAKKVRTQPALSTEENQTKLQALRELLKNASTTS